MVILLPPSEAKAAGGDGPPVGPGSLVCPELDPVRAELLAEVVALAQADPAAAAAALRLPASRAAAALRTTAAAASAPTLPALLRYTGVLYAHLDPATLPEGAWARGCASVLVFSGLWGVVLGGDPVPDYRVPAAAVLPARGPVASRWRAGLAAALPELLGERTLVDLRSSDYAGLWHPPAPRRTVRVRVVAQRDGPADATATRAATRPATPLATPPATRPATTAGKQVKGRLARALLCAPALPGDPDELAGWVAAALGDLGLQAYLGEPARPREAPPGAAPVVTGVVPPGWRPG